MGVDSTLLKYEMIARRRHCSSSRKHHREKRKERKGKEDKMQRSCMIMIVSWYRLTDGFRLF